MLKSSNLLPRHKSSLNELEFVTFISNLFYLPTQKVKGQVGGTKPLDSVVTPKTKDWHQTTPVQTSVCCDIWWKDKINKSEQLCSSESLLLIWAGLIDWLNDWLTGSVIFTMTVSPQRDKQTTVHPLRLCRRRRWGVSSLPHADVALPDVLPLLPALGQRAGGAVRGGGGRLHSGQPETVDVGEVVAGSSGPLTLHEGQGPEVCQAATWWCQRLAATLVTCTCMLQHTGNDIIIIIITIIRC